MSMTNVVLQHQETQPTLLTEQERDAIWAEVIAQTDFTAIGKFPAVPIFWTRHKGSN